MDGFEANEGIIIIAATNRPDVLDPALLRPAASTARSSCEPDVIGRERILRVHVRKVPLSPDVDLKVIARGTPGFSGADLMNLVNEAALLAARRGKRIVTMHEFEDAKDKVMMGAEPSGAPRHDRGREAAHRLSRGRPRHRGLQRPGDRPVHKATIIPRGRALGMVMQLPERDKLSMSFEQRPRASHHDGRPRRRGDDLRPRQGHLRRAVGHRAGDAAGPHDGDPLGLQP